MPARSQYTCAACWPVKRPMGQSLLLCGANCGLHHHRVVVATTNAILCVCVRLVDFSSHTLRVPSIVLPGAAAAFSSTQGFSGPECTVFYVLRVSPILITLVSRLPIRGSRSSHCPDQVWVSCTLIRIFNALELDWIGHCCFGCRLCDTQIRLPRGFLHFHQY